jgi:hypothetical protein
MTNQMRLGWAAFVAACCIGTACVPWEEAREEFCQNADPARQQRICPADGGADPLPDAGTDGGTQPTNCKVPSDCPAPQPGQCVDPGTCVDGRCVYLFKEDGTGCSGTPLEPCRESTGTCKRGICDYTQKSSGPCEDGNLCTEGDSCNSAGNCIGTAKVCNNTDPAKQCYEPTGMCSNATGECVFTPKPLNAPCNDGIACTVSDACNGAGSCGGRTLDCSNPPTCRQWTGTCSNGACDWTLKVANSACDDGDLCTTGDVCNGSGQCSPGPAVTCPNRRQECLALEGCVPNRGCVYQEYCHPTEEYCDRGVCCSRPNGAVADGLPDENLAFPVCTLH